jgi:predicted amidophosphoribosyltransferase
MTPEELTNGDARRRARAHERYWARRTAGLCVSCGAPAVPGRPRCPRCLEREQNRYRPPKPKHDPEALTRAVHELELFNAKRKQQGLPALTYGQWRLQGG